MAQTAIGGTASFRSDGVQYALRGDCMVSPSPFERTGQAGMDGVHGFTEQHRVPFISVTLSTTPDLSTEALDNIDDQTVQVDLVNGRSYMLRNAWCKAGLEINTAQGSIAVRFEGISCEEI